MGASITLLSVCTVYLGIRELHCGKWDAVWYGPLVWVVNEVLSQRSDEGCCAQRPRS